VTVCRIAESRPALDGVRNAERPERRLERRAQALERRHDHRDRLRRDAVADQAQDLLADELERAPRAGSLEPADGAFQLRRLGNGRVREERPLEMGEGGRPELGRARPQ
jgi:hypothetical protein